MLCVAQGGENLIMLKLDGLSGESVIEQLRNALAKKFTRVIDVFKDWDDDGNGMVNRTEFRKALSVLGLRVERAVAEELFDSFDADGSGEIDYMELHQQLRSGAIDIILKSENAIAQSGDMTDDHERYARQIRQGPDRSPRKSPRPAAAEDVGSFGSGRGNALQGSWKQAVRAEAEARKRLMRLQRELEKTKLKSAMAMYHETRRTEVAAIRTDMAQRVGSDLTEKFACIETASKEEVRLLSVRFNVRMSQILLPSQQNWFYLFRVVDADGSGRISYDEFERMIREPLKLKSGKLPNVKLQALWKALDEDDSGWISTGEFGRFMKLGAQQAADHVAQKVAKSKAAKAEEARLVKEETDKLTGRDMTARLESLPAATKEETLALSKEFNEKMARTLPPKEQEWYRIFKQVDTDQSGRISITEFTDIVRKTIRIGTEQVSKAKLQALWKSLDEDRSGYIDAGEFGRFMKLGQIDAGVDYLDRSSANMQRIQEMRLQKMEKRISAAKEAEAAHLQRQTQKVKDQKREIEIEVARIEAALAEAQQLRTTRRINLELPTRQSGVSSAGATSRRGPPSFVDPLPSPPSNFPTHEALAQSASDGTSPRMARITSRSAQRGYTSFFSPRDNSEFAVPFAGVLPELNGRSRVSSE